MKYTITCSEEQALVIQDALELFARLRMGQFDSIRWLVFPEVHGGNVSVDDCQQLSNLLNIVGDHAASLVGTKYAGISNDAVGDNAKRAWIAYQNIRHALAWSKVPLGKTRPDMCVRYNEPMNLLNEPMPEVTYDETTKDDC